MAVFGLLGVFSLIRYLERTKRELYNFLDAIRQYDFTQTSLQQYSPDNKDLRSVYNEIQYIFRTLHTEKETHHLFLQTIIKHVDTAIVAYKSDGAIIEANEAVKNMFGIPYFKSLDRLLRNETRLYDRIFHEQESDFTYKTTIKGNIKVLSIKAADFVIKDTTYKLVSFQDIRSELEEKELDSWQKLIRILTHEIMNSAIPIATLASVISQIMIDDEGDIKQSLSKEEKSDIYGGLQTIENRSKGLSAFVDSYRTLTKIKPPQLASVDMKKLVVSNLMLLDSKLKERQVKVINNMELVWIDVDAELISQVIINLILNAIDAMEDSDKRILTITSFQEKSGLAIKFCDTGHGINEETLENIFIPFFSTKKNGSGIGLSLARQILRMHKSKISVSTIAGEGTCFTLEF